VDRTSSGVLALRVLVHTLSSSPVLWLLARRPVPAPSAAQEAIDWLVEQGAGQLTLDSLTETSVGRLCRNVLGKVVDATVLEQAARAHGNPFLLEQLLGALRPPDRSSSLTGSPRSSVTSCPPVSWPPSGSACAG